MDFTEEIRECRVCNTSNLKKFISFGKMPAANAFLKKEQLNDWEYKYDMEVGFCENCKMVQLINIVPYDKYIIPDETGKTHYAFFSSTSKFMEKHFAEMANEIKTRFLNYGDKVLEIGGNDGIMLKAFDKNVNPVLNIEPSENVADISRSLGIETISEFFTKEFAESLSQQRGKFKAITSTNVFLNIIDIHSCMAGIKHLLDYKGVFITEDPYLGDILDKVAYDQIYDEHIWYFSLTSLNNLYDKYDMEIFDAEKQWVHGGSMKVYACKKGDYEKTSRLLEYLQEEQEKNFNFLETYEKFTEKVEKNKEKLMTLIYDLKSKGKKIVGYAAASKGTIVQNYCNLSPEIIDYISDSTPSKQGLYSPGKHIPIVSPDKFHMDNADYAILGAWNHAEEIMEKEKDFIERGGRFIVHLPTPKIVEPEPNILKTHEMYENEMEDIQIKELKVFDLGEEGYLFETLKNDDAMYGNKFGQVLVSGVNPGVKKGLHRHHKQDEYTWVVQGNVIYVAIKETKEGPIIKKFIAGDKNPIMIKTPKGWWHGYMPLDDKMAVLSYVMDKTFDPKDPDTDEIDVNSFGEDIWKID